MNKLFSWAIGSERSPPNFPQKRVKLALQGGGAHGAFTWGVLDHLLEDGRLGIDGISGASAGAVNAAMLADGLIRGGPDEARKRLADFWRAASVDGSLPAVTSFCGRAIGGERADENLAQFHGPFAIAQPHEPAQH